MDFSGAITINDVVKIGDQIKSAKATITINGQSKVLTFGQSQF